VYTARDILPKRERGILDRTPGKDEVTSKEIVGHWNRAFFPDTKGQNVVIQVRLEGPSEEAVRQLAKEWGVQVSTVKRRTDTWHLYGTKIV
jgi:hypothetical protein